MSKKDDDSDCCNKIRRKGRFCKDCPLAASLKKKQRKKLIRKYSEK